MLAETVQRGRLFVEGDVSASERLRPAPSDIFEQLCSNGRHHTPFSVWYVKHVWLRGGIISGAFRKISRKQIISVQRFILPVSIV